MRPLCFIFILVVGKLFINCNPKTDAGASEVIREQVTLTEEVDDVPPPPPEFFSRFKTLQEWLFSICDTEIPKKSIAIFNFGLFESSEDYTLFLVGLNRYDITPYQSAPRIDFEPANMYLTLPKSEYKNLGREQVVERLTSQLKEFTKTDKFRHSFFARAKVITTDFKGEIWSK